MLYLHREAYEQQSAWGFHQCCVVRSKDETRHTLPAPRNGKRRNGAGFLLGRRPKKELAYPKANVKPGPFTSSRRGPRPRARPAEQFAGSAGTDCARCTGSRDRSDDSATRREWQSQSGDDFPTITDDGNSLMMGTRFRPLYSSPATAQSFARVTEGEKLQDLVPQQGRFLKPPARLSLVQVGTRAARTDGLGSCLESEPAPFSAS